MARLVQPAQVRMQLWCCLGPCSSIMKSSNNSSHSGSKVGACPGPTEPGPGPEATISTVWQSEERRIVKTCSPHETWCKQRLVVSRPLVSHPGSAHTL